MLTFNGNNHGIQYFFVLVSMFYVSVRCPCSEGNIFSFVDVHVPTVTSFVAAFLEDLDFL